MMSITRDVSRNEQFWIGMVFGIFCTVLVGLSLDKIFGGTGVSTVEMPKDIISAYNRGIKDALHTNPASADLDIACAALWSNKQ
jgi:hypothetical protein